MPDQARVDHIPDSLVDDAEFRRRVRELMIQRYYQYENGTDSERLLILQGILIRELWYGQCGQYPQINVAKFTKAYPDFEKHIDGIADALAEAFVESKQEVLQWFVYETTTPAT